MPKGIKGFQKGHLPFPGIEKGQFKMGNIPTKNWYAVMSGAKGANSFHWKGGKQKLICLSCQNNFYVDPYLKNVAKFCSKKCNGQYKSLHLIGEKAPRWEGGLPNCLKCNKKLSNRRLKNNLCHQCFGIKNSGPNNPRWIQDRNMLKREDLRGDALYKRWRREVQNRDGNRCVDCGEIKKGEMEINHIFGWTAYPRLRYEVENGETLCKQCHRVKTSAQMKKSNILIYSF